MNSDREELNYPHQGGTLGCTHWAAPTVVDRTAADFTVVAPPSSSPPSSGPPLSRCGCCALLSRWRTRPQWWGLQRQAH